ncbi:chorismate--pyruvate lyase family protein [Chitinilyticum aquatile]|uniref:chorismate--pyruvate lyase family protein n=1 Tax=Chitinilyticum aquatile TaxID=362520 RepID=UPI00040B7A4F|nr:chorismate lyase [Chitinilyticum aquatile]
MTSTRLWRHPLALAPRDLRPWLAARGSLTARLMAHFPEIRVSVLRQGWDQPHGDEIAIMQLPRGGTQVAVREVILASRGTPLVYAHSITARSALARGFHLLGRTGSRPLGALLFADPTIRRSPLAWRCIDARHPLYQSARAAVGPLPPRLWARRSLFHSGRDVLLVTEVFLPALANAS